MMMTATTFAARQHRLERKANGKANGKGTGPVPDRDDAEPASAQLVDTQLADTQLADKRVASTTDQVEQSNERATDRANEHADERLSRDRTPWRWPRIVTQHDGSSSKHKDDYTLLKQRLARVPSLSKHTRQTLYVDLWTGQHWLGLRMSCGEIPACQNNQSPPPTARERELLAPVSSDTALSIASSPFGLQ